MSMCQGYYMKLIPLSLLFLSVSSYADIEYKLTEIVNSPSGKYQGLEQEGYLQFKGIPYAEPPVGEKRWQAPENKSVMEGVYFSGKFGNSCATTVSLAGFSKISQSEDCLYLNVYAPKDNEGKKRPVLVWIPGGGLRTGSGDEYDVSNFIKKDIVVVTINYRLGVFGFFSHPALNHESKKINYGLLDQQKALSWVQRNIASFGGDPDNVTLFGESAGGHSVLANIVSPLSSGLFKKAIISSGSYNLDQKNIAQANAVGLEVAKAVGCDDGTPDGQLACLKKTPVAKLATTAISNLYNDQFTIDGDIIPYTFNEAIAKGKVNKVDIINGFQNNEGTFFAGVIENDAGKKIDKQIYTASMMTLYGKSFSSVEETDDNTDFTAKLSDDLTKYKFICPSLQFNAEMAKKNRLYAYVFNDKTAPQYIPKMSRPYLAAHTSELIYFFDGFHGATGVKQALTKEQQRLSDNIVSYLSNFIKNGDPNQGAPVREKWTEFNTEHMMAIEFSDKGIFDINNLSKKYVCPQ